VIVWRQSALLSSSMLASNQINSTFCTIFTLARRRGLASFDVIQISYHHHRVIYLASNIERKWTQWMNISWWFEEVCLARSNFDKVKVEVQTKKKCKIALRGTLTNWYPPLELIFCS
jgi:hypothetical protein